VCTGRRSLRNTLKGQTVNGSKVIATPLKTAGSEGSEERSRGMNDKAKAIGLSVKCVPEDEV